jgi:hypothetical protein
MAERPTVMPQASGGAAGGGVRKGRPEVRPGDGASNGDAICLTSFMVRHPRLRQRVSMFEACVCGHHQSLAPRRCLTRLSETRVSVVKCFGPTVFTNFGPGGVAV